MNDAFFNLSWQIQVSLAGGYAAYLLAYTGIRQHHTATDVAFASIMFGAFVTLTFAIAPSGNPIAASMTGIVVACAIAIIWRKYFRRIAFEHLHTWDVTWSDDDPSALATLCANNRHPISQLGVQLDDGTWLYCLNPGQFEGREATPFRPITIGPSGDIALYLTHMESPGEEMRETKTVRDSRYGDRVTYVPADRIRRMTLRHVRLNHPSRAVLESAAQRSH